MKKKLMAIALAVCVVAVLAAGASLAYFTDQTKAANNTFTMGNVKITLDETDLTKDNGSRTPEGNTYTNLYPGMDMGTDFSCSSCSVMVCIIYQSKNSTKLPIYSGDS